MYSLNRHRLEDLLRARGLSLAAFARKCGISRKSLYEFFRGRQIFSTPFAKILAELGVAFEDLIVRTTPLDILLEEAPESIRRALLRATDYARKYEADLFLFGSRARGKQGVRADWDVGIFFPGGMRPKGFAAFKQRLQDAAFPFRLDLVDLTNAPPWFLRSVAADVLRLFGSTDPKVIFNKRM